MTKEEINLQIKDSSDQQLDSKFIAAAVYINEDGELYHAGIAIGSDAGKRLIHLNDTILDEELNRYQYFILKNFEHIPKDEAEAFYVHAKDAVNSSSIVMGYYYDGTYFREGRFIIPGNEPYTRMSCVGFCLSILRGWNIDDDYIEFGDWNAANSLSAEAEANELESLKALYPNLTEADLKTNIRRIKPSEYLAGAFIKTTPIRKAHLAPIVPILKEIAIERRPPAQQAVG